MEYIYRRMFGKKCYIDKKHDQSDKYQKLNKMFEMAVD